MRDAQRNVARARAAQVTRGGLLDAADMVQGELNRSTLAPGAAAESSRGDVISSPFFYLLIFFYRVKLKSTRVRLL